MDKAFYQMAAIESRKVYDKNIDLGTTEFFVKKYSFLGEAINVISIAGTNEIKDWKDNANLMSKNGVKKSAYDAAIEIAIKLRSDHLIDFSKRTVVTGHSKGGAEAIAYHKVVGKYFPAYASTWCVAFAPARSLRYWTNRKLKNTTIFTDPDDPVSFIGRISFGHPVCEHIKAKDDHFGFKISDHDMDNWVRFTNNM